MKIIDILKQRSENANDDVKIELKLYNLADDLEKKSRNHLKRVTTVLTEFDIHDEKHLANRSLFSHPIPSYEPYR